MLDNTAKDHILTLLSKFTLDPPRIRKSAQTPPNKAYIVAYTLKNTNIGPYLPENRQPQTVENTSREQKQIPANGEKPSNSARKENKPFKQTWKVLKLAGLKS